MRLLRAAPLRGAVGAIAGGWDPKVGWAGVPAALFRQYSNVLSPARGARGPSLDRAGAARIPIRGVAIAAQVRQGC